MNKIHLTLEVNKFNKDKIVDREYTTKAGDVVTNKEYQVEVIELKEKKFVTQGDNWKLFKTHFVVEKKDNIDAPDVYVGNGFQFERDDDEAQKTFDSITSKGANGEVIDVNDIPF